MTLSLGIIGMRSRPLVVEWLPRDVMLYALATGASQFDPTEELSLTTENSIGKTLRVLPTFAAMLAQRVNSQIVLPSIDRGKVLQASQGVALTRPLDVQGKVLLSSEINGLEFKQSGALLYRTTTAVDAATGEEIFVAQTSAFVRDECGKGSHGVVPPQLSNVPNGPPTFEQSVTTRKDQALLYRLTGDRNPLHSDPAFSSRYGFAKPILHGLCTFGITARMMLNEFTDGEVDQFSAMNCRFARPVVPGQTLTVRAWRTADDIAFQTLNDAGETVLAFGQFQLRAPA